MPSSLHEALIEMFRHRPSLVAELLGDALGVDLPTYEVARLESSEFTDLAPTEYRADAVVVLTAGVKPVLAVVVEVQLGRDGDKRWSWPVYLATLRAASLLDGAAGGLHRRRDGRLVRHPDRARARRDLVPAGAGTGPGAGGDRCR